MALYCRQLKLKHPKLFVKKLVWYKAFLWIENTFRGKSVQAHTSLKSKHTLRGTVAPRVDESHRCHCPLSLPMFPTAYELWGTKKSSFYLNCFADPVGVQRMMMISVFLCVRWGLVVPPIVMIIKMQFTGHGKHQQEMRKTAKTLCIQCKYVYHLTLMSCCRKVSEAWPTICSSSDALEIWLTMCKV